MTGSTIIKGHSLLPVNQQEPYKAQCSCGAWEKLILVPSSTGRAKARRNWHDEHKRNVWRRKHPEDFREDRPIVDDPEAFRY
jgi:hypothetical protein